MCDSRKTKKTLIEELKTLRSRAAELERVDAEHEKVEQKLKQYQFMVESAHDSIFFKDLKSRYIIANDKTLEAFGLSREQVIGKNDYEIMPEKAEAGKNIEDDKHVFKTGKPTEITKHMTGSDGKERWFQAIKVPQFDDEGKIIGLIGIARDITAIKRAEETQRESQRWQRAILDSIPDMAWLKDKDSRYIAANEPLCKAFSIKLEDLVGRTDFDISPEDLAKKYRADDKEVMKSGKRKRVEEPWGKKDGKRIWIETIKTPICNDNGKVIGTSGIARDITVHMKTQEQLQAKTAILQNIISNIPFYVFWKDKNSVYLGCNDNFAKLAGIEKPDDIIGKSDCDLPWREEESDFYRKIDKEVMTKVTPKLNIEESVHLPDGKVATVLTSKVPMQDANGEVIGVLGIFTDITERKKAEEALTKSKVQAERYLNIAKVMIAAVDANEKINMINKKGCEYLGYKERELIGKNWFNLLVPKRIRKDVRGVFNNLMAEKVKPVEVYENELVTKKGEERIFTFHNTILKDSGGKINGVLFSAEDITEHRQDVEALRESENKYRTLVENLPQKIFFKDGNSVYVSCNDNLARDFKIKSEEVAGKTDYDLVPKELAEKYREDDKRIIESGKTEDIEEKYIRQGKERIIHTVKTPVKDERGNVTGILGIFWDITEHKKAEEALKESEQRFRSLVETSSDWVWEVDQNGIYTYASPKVEELLGYGPEEIIGRTPFDLMPPDEAERVGAIFQDIAASRKPFERLENTNFHKDGRLVVLETSGVPIFDGGGNLLGYRGIDRDITERKRAEEALRKSEEKYRLLFEGTGTDNTVISVDGVYLMMNEKGAEHLGGRPEHFIGKSVYDTFSKEAADEYVKRFRHIAESGETQTYEDLVELRAGSRWFLTNMWPAKDPDGNITSVQLISQDITEHKKAEEELLFKSTLLEAQSETSIDGILVVDTEGKSLSFNKNFGRMWNLPKEILDTRDDEKMIQYVLSQLKNPEKFLERVKYLYAHKNEKSRDEIQFRDGRVFDRYSSPLLDSNDKHYGRVWYFRDVTKRRRAEEAYHAIVDHSLQGFAIFQDERVVFANQAMAEITGYTVEEMLTMPSQQVQVFVHPEDRALVWDRHRDRLKGKELPERYEFRGIRKDGTICWLEIHPRRIEYRGKPAVEAAYLDITERRRAEEALRKARDELETRVEQRTADLAKANVQLRSLASELSLAEERLRRRIATNVHDHVGQNLAISKIKIESLRESVTSSELAEDLEEIRDLIAQTIESTRSLTFELSPPVLYELGFEAAVEWLVRQTRQQHRLSTEFKGDGQTKPLDNNVRILLFQAVRELLVNVVKHAQAQNVTVSTRRVGNEIRVSVEDDGVGFDISKTGSHDYKTGGFGLFSIRERLGHIGGRFEIESRPGQGTRVTLTAPIEQENQNSKEQRK